MAGKTLANLNVIIAARSKAFDQSLNRISRRLNKFERRVSRVGRSFAANFTAPIIAGAALGSRSFLSLSENLNKIQNLVGVSGKTLEDFRQGLKRISSEVGVTQIALSDALFTVTSAGLRGAEALEVLEEAAKGTAVGLGDTKEIARATTAVLQAYGSENITASKAANVLFNTIKEGNLEASELAPNLGKVIGVASSLGVSFEEIGANIATFTRLGVSAEEATTSLTAVMSSFLNPGKKARQELAKMGVTVDELRKSIRERGLAQTMIDLMEATDGNFDAIGNLIPNVRALKNILGTTGQQSKEYLRIVNALKEDHEGLANAFEQVSASPAQQLRKAFVSLQNIGIEIGAVVVPIIVKIAEKIKTVTDRFASLDEKTKENIVRIGLLVAAIGPALLAVSKLASGISGVVGALKFIVSPAGLAVTAIAGLAVAAIYVAKNWEAFEGRFKNVWIRVKNALKASIRSILKGLDRLQKALGLNLFNLNFEGTKLEYEDLVDVKSFKSFGETMKEFGNDMLDLIGLSEKVKLPGSEPGALSSGTSSTGSTTTPRTTTTAPTTSIFDGGGGPAPDSGEKKAKNMIWLPGLGVVHKSVLGKLHQRFLNSVKPLEKKLKIEPAPIRLNIVTNAHTKLNELREQLERAQSPEAFDRINEQIREQEDIIDGLGKKYGELAENQKTNVDEMTEAVKGHVDIADTMRGLLQDSLSSFADALAGFASGATSLGQLAISAFMPLLNVIGKVGDIAIKTGVTMLTINKALKFGNPFAAIAAGTALKILAGVVKSQLRKSLPKAKHGTILDKETALIAGEYSDAKSNPEIVAPLNKLTGIMSNVMRSMLLPVMNTMSVRPAPMLSTSTNNETKTVELVFERGAIRAMMDYDRFIDISTS